MKYRLYVTGTNGYYNLGTYDQSIEKTLNEVLDKVRGINND